MMMMMMIGNTRPFFECTINIVNRDIYVSLLHPPMRFRFYVVCLFVSIGLCENYWTDFHKIRWKSISHTGQGGTDYLDFDANPDHVTLELG